MIHVIPQTHSEKVTMYMKLTKRELAEMLVNANEAFGSEGQRSWEVVKWSPPTYSPTGSNTCLTS